MTVHKLTGVSYVSNLNAHFIGINFQWKNKRIFCATFLKLCLHGCGCDSGITFLVNTYRHVHTSREKYPSPPSNRSISVCIRLMSWGFPRSVISACQNNSVNLSFCICDILSFFCFISLEPFHLSVSFSCVSWVTSLVFSTFTNNLMLNLYAVYTK